MPLTLKWWQYEKLADSWSFHVRESIVLVYSCITNNAIHNLTIMLLLFKDKEIFPVLIININERSSINEPQNKRLQPGMVLSKSWSNYVALTNNAQHKRCRYGKGYLIYFILTVCVYCIDMIQVSKWFK